jgi:plasmid maintenance system antidote protein VapI
MREDNIFDEAAKDMTLEHKFFVNFGFSFAKQIRYELSVHPHINTQKDLAIAMKKTESEISRMLTGLHNLTLDSISKLCFVFGKELILTDLMAQEKYNSTLATGNEGNMIFINITINQFIILPMRNNNDEYQETVTLQDLFDSMPILPSKELMLS